MSATISCAICGNSVPAGGQRCAHCGNDISSEQALVATARVNGRISLSKMLESSILAELWQATLGEYAITGELGRGGMAIVYQAHDIALDRPVAIKVMAPALLEDDAMVERFQREARTSASLSHPHIIPIYAVKQTEQLLYFIMKLVAGRSLDSICEEVGALEIRLVQALVTQVGSALGYAHRHGVIHRDIKPANIMIDEEGFAVVMDFGIAKSHNAPGLTETGVVVGTPNYIAPEQVAGKQITGASDQYAFGVTLYQLLTGRPPFTGSVSEILKMQMLDEAPGLEQLRSDCPAPLRDAVHRMLAKDPDQRFPTMEDLVAEVGAVTLAGDDPVHTRMIEFAKVGAKQQREARVSAPASPPLSVLASGGRELETWKTPEPTVVTRPERSSRFGRILLAAALVLLVGGGIGWAYVEFVGGRGDVATSVPGLADPAASDAATPAESTAPAAIVSSAGPPSASGPSPRGATQPAGGTRTEPTDPTPDVDPDPPPPAVGAPARVEAGAGAPRAQPVASETQFGVILVRLLTWADVTVDGVSHGRQNRVFVDTLSADVPHLLQFSREGFVPLDTTLVLEAGAQQRLQIRLRPLQEFRP